ncbi:amidohydrolase [Prosthecochloris sp. SCSIO W1101]|uniref:amidohydrolase n=1 Tax=Prosthecochloris sp. SCSIO W1101 TaxID=2992242 RepID=UPI00223D22CF|nr:amidohydrolase [Prosthecochloris sp. SCSIO W1101]UZJ40226.1 amidohydrolase [Prosthecochloris sp. SCSIO W1101]
MKGFRSINCWPSIRSMLATFVLVVGYCSNGSAAESLQNLYYTTSAPTGGVTIFTAKEIVTMSPVVKSATAVAVRDGIIIDVGKKKDLLKRFRNAKRVTVDNTFSGKVLTPGLIDPHLHFWLFALVANAQFITPADWQLPWGDVKGVVGQQAYMERLKELEAGMDDPDEILFTWGYHEAFHGKINRATLDELSTTRPIIVWQRSVHEFFFNTKALEMLEQKEADWQGKGESSAMADWKEGHVWEKGLYLVMEKLLPVIGSPEKFKLGLERARQYVHAGGLTAASDPGVQLPESMIRQMISILEGGPMPFDYYLIPAGNTLYELNGKDGNKAVAAARGQVQRLNGRRVKWLPNQIKLFTDGAVFSQLMQMKDGYLDGHEGEWIQSPDDFADSAWAFWKEGYQLVVHQNGDLGMEVCLNTLEDLLNRKRRNDHRFGIHHFAYSQEPQVKRAAKMGANISSNPFYIHVLGEQYSKVGVGPERSEVMVRGRTVLDEGMRLSFHSDAPMAPARPMLLAWSAVNRIGLSGKNVLGPQEKVTTEEAFRALTIDAAYALRKEKEMGSIDVGKKANFTVFEENPIKADPMKLKDLAIWGTVFEGQQFPIKKANKRSVMVSPEHQERMAVLAKDEHAICHDHHDHHGDACTANRILQAFAALQED